MPFIRHGLFCGLEFEKSKDSPRIQLVKGRKVEVWESTDLRLGALVTYSTNRSRKSFYPAQTRKPFFCRSPGHRKFCSGSRTLPQTHGCGGAIEQKPANSGQVAGFPNLAAGSQKFFHFIWMNRLFRIVPNALGWIDVGLDA